MFKCHNEHYLLYIHHDIVSKNRKNDIMILYIHHSMAQKLALGGEAHFGDSPKPP